MYRHGHFVSSNLSWKKNGQSGYLQKRLTEHVVTSSFELLVTFTSTFDRVGYSVLIKSIVLQLYVLTHGVTSDFSLLMTICSPYPVTNLHSVYSLLYYTADKE